MNKKTIRFRESKQNRESLYPIATYRGRETKQRALTEPLSSRNMCARFGTDWFSIQLPSLSNPHTNVHYFL